MSKFPGREVIEAAKEKLRIPELWRLLGLPGEPKALSHSPFRKDCHPSFSIFHEGRQAKDHATGEMFDGPAVVAKALGLSPGDGVRRFLELAGGDTNVNACAPKQDCPRNETPPRKPDLSKFRIPTDAEIGAIARDRGGLSSAAPEITKLLGCLKVGSVCGFHSWILTDPARWNAEARRFGRLPYPPYGELSERKAHTVRGSLKSWPIGVGVDRTLVEKASLIVVVEGGPDLLAAWHFVHRAKRWDVLPIAILGRAVHGLHPDALALLAGKRIKFFPHVDPDGGGFRQVELISKQQLRAIGCRPTWFDLTGLRTCDGRPAKDLNDLTQLDANQLGEIEDLFL